jgi:hypothetical protein
VEQVCTEEGGSDRMMENIVHWELHDTCDSPLVDIREIKLRSLRLSENVESVGQTRSAEGV